MDEETSLEIAAEIRQTIRIKAKSGKNNPVVIVPSSRIYTSEFPLATGLMIVISTTPSDDDDDDDNDASSLLPPPTAFGCSIWRITEDLF